MPEERRERGSLTEAETQADRVREGRGPSASLYSQHRGAHAGVDLERETLPQIPDETGAEPDLRAHLKAFATSPNFNSFIPVARQLIELAELPAPAKQELTSLFSDSRPREETLMLSDSFLGYAPLVSRLPGREDAGSWAQDRARYPELFCILGIVTAIAKLAKADRMLTQSVLAAEPSRQGKAEREDLKKRLMGAYETALLPGGSSCIQMVENEAQDKNPLAVTRFLKGYLVPIFEIDHGIKVGVFKRIGYAFDEEVISPELSDLAEGGMNPVQSRALNRFRAAASPLDAKTELKQGVLLKDLVAPPSIDVNFIDSVLHSQANTEEKIIYLSEALASAQLVQEKAFYALIEKLPRGVRATGDVKASGWAALKESIKVVGLEIQAEGEKHYFDVPLFLTALAKVSAIENTGYFKLARRSFDEACKASRGWNELHYSFKHRYDVYVDHLCEQALKRRRR